jgi:single-stranded DNA-specific DHH superfamily exonuclease
MKKHKVNILIVLDIGIDSAPHTLREYCAFDKCLVIDHHTMYKDLNSEDTVFLKAQFFTKKDPSSYVTSKFAFDLFSKVTDVKKLDWVACVGIIGDMSLKNWKPFVKKTIQKRKISLTQLYEAEDLIAAVEALADEDLGKLFKAFYKAKRLQDVLKSGLTKYLKRFRKEKAVIVEGFDDKSEKFPELELFIYCIKNKQENLKSYVINEISLMHPNKTVILMQDLGGNRVRFSGRRQDFKVKINQLLVNATKNIPESTAGGHIPAAAGSIPKKYLKKFRANLLRILKKKYKA